MSKLQLITKAVITAIGVSTAAGFLSYSYLFPRYPENTHVLFILLNSIIPLTFLTTVIYGLIFRNNWLVMIASGNKGQSVSIDPLEQKKTLAIWLKLLLVFSGLHLLVKASHVFRLLLYLSPVKIRAWIQGLFNGDYPVMSDFFSPVARINFLYILTLALAIYLIMGAPHLVKWHIKRLPVTNNNTDLSGGNDNE
jgi:hypothetical protein